MADFNSDIAAKQLNPEMGNRNDPVKELAGAFVTHAVYTVDATEVVNDRIFICNAPERSKLIPELSSVVNDAVGGTSAIISVGTDANPDRYASALDVTAAGIDRFDVSGDDDVSSDPISTEEERGVYATLTTLTAAMTSGKKLKFVLVFAANS